MVNGITDAGRLKTVGGATGAKLGTTGRAGNAGCTTGLCWMNVGACTTVGVC